MQSDGLLQKLKDDLISYNRSGATQRTYLAIASCFLKSLKNKQNISDSDVASYLARLRESGKSGNTIRYTHYALRKLFLTNKIEFVRRPPPIMEINQPYFTKEEVEKMIKTAKLSCDAQQKAFLIMASIYALRRGEIITIRPKDIDKKNHTIFIHTEKGGIQREQFIPQNLRKYIYGYDWKDKVSKARMSNLFYVIMHNCKFDIDEMPQHSGWHMLRRTLVTCLRQLKVDGAVISKFLRWKSQQISSGSPMLAIYDKTEFSIVDQEIFNNHPFLKLW